MKQREGPQSMECPCQNMAWLHCALPLAGQLKLSPHSCQLTLPHKELLPQIRPHLLLQHKCILFNLIIS